MKRFLLAILAIGMISTAIGCHAEADVDKPQGHAMTFVPGR